MGSPLAVDASGAGVDHTALVPVEGLAAKKKAESKKEKEKRLNRVGLSYRCGRCGHRPTSR